MSKVIKEISCVVGEYTNKDGQIKKRYMRIGSIIETKIGNMLKLDSLPLREGGWDGWAYLNDPKPQEGREQPASRRPAPFDDMDSDVPF